MRSHEAKHDDRILLTETPALSITTKGLLLSQRHIEGLILAVICSPKNSDEKIPKNVSCPFFENAPLINELWGLDGLVRQRLDLSKNRWI